MHGLANKIYLHKGVNVMDVNHIRLRRCGLVTTTDCNLKCRLCCTSTPYLHSIGENYDYGMITKVIDRFFSVVEYVEKLALGGGEPLLRKDLPEYIEHIMQYSNQFGVVEIISNGTMLPTSKLINTLEKHKDKITVMIDHYGDISCHAEEFGQILTQHAISNRIRIYHGEDCHCGGWVDLGDYSLKHPTKKSQIIQYKKCAYATGNTLIGFSICGSTLSMCARASITQRKGILDKSCGDLVDLLDDHKTLQQLREELVALYNTECLAACAYCNGMCEDSKRFPPAEQLD